MVAVDADQGDPLHPALAKENRPRKMTVEWGADAKDVHPAKLPSFEPLGLPGFSQTIVGRIAA